MGKPSARERLAQAAFGLFLERGYEQTTVDEIAERAGLGRATFFRHYRSKEDVIFPDHDRLLEQVRDRLGSASHGTPLAAACDAVRLVLAHYLGEGDLARLRYSLTAAVPALRDREIVSAARYQRLLREYISGQRGDGTQPAALEAELMAAAVASAHNHVLRRWLRGEAADPLSELDEALLQVIALFAPRLQAPGGAVGTTVVAFRTGQPLDSLLPALEHLTDPPQGSARRTVELPLSAPRRWALACAHPAHRHESQTGGPDDADAGGLAHRGSLRADLDNPQEHPVTPLLSARAVRGSYGRADGSRLCAGCHRAQRRLPGCRLRARRCWPLVTPCPFRQKAVTRRPLRWTGRWSPRAPGYGPAVRCFGSTKINY